MAEKKTARDSKAAAQAPALETEFAHRLLDPFETLYQGLIRTNDPLLLEKGSAGDGAALYKDLKRDPKVYAGMQKRTLATISKPFNVEPIEKSERGKADAGVLLSILKGFSFDGLCEELLEARLTGTAINEVVFIARNGRIEVSRAPSRALRRFVFVQQDPGLPPELRMLTRQNMLTGEQLPERTFIVHRYKPADDNPWGTGLGLVLYWSVFFKRKAKISWNRLNDRVGMPIPWGKHPRNAQKDEKATLFAALKALTSDGVVMTPEGTLIELIESKLASGGITSQQALCEYLDDEIDAVLLSQEARGKSGGALASASKERSSGLLDLAQAEWDLVAETLNRTLIAWLCEINGLVPCLVSRKVKEEVDLQAEAETDKAISDLGFELDEAVVQAKYGEGWHKKAAPVVPPGGTAPGQPGQQQQPNKPAKAPADPGSSPAFSEAPLSSGQLAVDEAIAAVKDEKLREAMRGVMEPLLQAIEGASSFEEALAAAEAAYPKLDKSALQSLLARALFGAETFGAQEPAGE